MRLSHQDYDALQGAILELHDYRDLAAFRQALPEILLKLIPADYFFLMEIKLTPQPNGEKIVDLIDPSHQITPELLQLADHMNFDHPFPSYFFETGDPTALKLSDFFSVPRFQRTEMYQLFYRVLAIERQLTAPANFGNGTVGAFTFGGDQKDFTERDRLVVNLLRPHIELARCNSGRVTSSRSRSKALTDYGLTPREAEIARWVAAGKTNVEIAIILVANVRTVEKHVESILSKLGVENRTTAAVTITRANAGFQSAKWR